MDVERGRHDEPERESLLPSYSKTEDDNEPGSFSNDSQKPAAFCTRRRFSALHISIAFVVGLLSCFGAQYAYCGTECFQGQSAPSAVDVFAAPGAGSSEVHNYPPTAPVNADPLPFPTNIGYAGVTPTGAEPAVIATAPYYPQHTDAAVLVAPETLAKAHHKHKDSKFNLFRKWGNLSPWYSVGKTAFGLDSSPEAPESCSVTGLHFLHRHGARYPTSYASYGGPANFSSRLNAVADQWTTSGDMEFMNDWTYKLGEEVLTPFGRQQLYDLGISLRLKYGYLLQNFTDSNTLPVFRTESQHRMLHSALNFATGFFGIPIEGQYQQSITIEASGFNNTLAPYTTCANTRDKTKAERGNWYASKWADIYLEKAQERLQSQMKGYELSIEDVFTLQQMCAYETVAIGFSKFCELFTEEEWEGFNYALDLSFWYNSAFGSPLARVQGAGYIQEMLARLTHTPISHHRFSTNSTLDDDSVTFPLNQSLYVDATHEVVVLNIITALNLNNFAASGPLPYTHIPKNRSFRVAELAPFATNIQFQLVECSTLPDPQIRIVINDGVTPLTGIEGCPEQEDGMCPLPVFVKAMEEMLEKVDWEWDCNGDWVIPEGWETVTGDPPSRK